MQQTGTRTPSRADGTREVSDFSEALKRLMAQRGVGVRQLAGAVYCNPGHLSNLRSGKARPSPELAAAIDERLQAGGVLVALAATDGKPAVVADEIAAIELARRAEASDVGNGTCERLELAVDDLATAYPCTAPAGLLPRVRAHLGYLTQLLDGRATLAQRRRLLVSGGWLSLLAATVLIDLDRDAPAVSYLRTAGQLARETGHDELAGWVLETRAWQVLSAGDHWTALTLSQGAQEIAPADGSAYKQATGQEGRAWARLGDAGQARDALDRLERIVSPMHEPDQPEHHYRYDPAKAESYTGAILSWIGDPAAEQAGREVLARLESPAVPPRYRRAVDARLDLALTLTGRGKLDEAAGTALEAVTSGYFVPSNYWRAEEIVTEVTRRDVPEGRDLADAYRTEISGNDGAEG